MKIALATVLLLAAAPAYAQYYPPPGYYPPPPPPGYYPPRPRFGRHCDATLPTPYGPRRVFCPIVEAKPIGEGCACPPPDGYGPDFVGGRTVR